MKTNVFVLLAALCVIAVSTGCYSTVEGRTRMGMPLAKDRITSRYERPVNEIFAAAKQVLSVYGTLTGENTIANTLEAKVDQNTVYVKVDAVEPNISQLTVQARTKSGMANIDLASEVDKRIALQLK